VNLIRTVIDPDIFRAAKLLNDEYGGDAPLQAAGRADELLDEGDVDGAAVWRQGGDRGYDARAE
jgi:hypothetical protein